MTRLFNDPELFVDEAINGFAAAHATTVSQVDGGVVRKNIADEHVALVIGGGSGHYPAFAGLVGQGLATGAVVGNVFASPSAQQICSVARAAERGRGVLFSFGNYTGDVLNFRSAKEQLESEGVPCRIVAVTDDIASAPPTETDRRRGVAGGLIVYKIAGRAADEGRSLEEVTRIAELANSRTRSLGVAFSGCSLPGSQSPLFTIPEGRMAVGMGVHGEPGILEDHLPTADELAEIFVSRLLSDVPTGITPNGSPAALILNGLGSLKFEELFIVYRKVDQLLREASVTIIAPEVGEFTTSFDMAGASLTLCWLTDELAELWVAPASTPAFQRGIVAPVNRRSAIAIETKRPDTIVPGSLKSRACASKALSALEAISAAIDETADELGRLDAIAGDGDHGLGMKRGAHAALTAATSAATEGAGVGTLLERAGAAWAAAGGGTSGALWGVLLSALGSAFGDRSMVSPGRMSEGFKKAAGEIMRVGGAAVGDKSMVDVLVPFTNSFSGSVTSGASISDSWEAAVSVANASAESTSDMTPKVGRARPLSNRSVGSPDPGAVSLAIALSAAHDALVEPNTREATATE